MTAVDHSSAREWGAFPRFLHHALGMGCTLRDHHTKAALRYHPLVWLPLSTDCTTLPPSPAIPRRTSTSMPGCSGCDWSSGASTRTTLRLTTCSTPTRSAIRVL